MVFSLRFNPVLTFYQLACFPEFGKTGGGGGGLLPPPPPLIPHGIYSRAALRGFYDLLSSVLEFHYIRDDKLFIFYSNGTI